MQGRRLAIVTALLAISVGTMAFISQTPGTAAAQGPVGPHGAPEPPMLGIHWARGQGGGSTSSSPNLNYHSSPVMDVGTVVQPIFWGTSWPTYVGDKVSGMDSFYAGAGGTKYIGTNTEYTDSAGHVSSVVTGVTHISDGSAAPNHAPRTSAVLAEVAKLYPNPTPGAYYPVYVDTKRGGAGYCGWHSWGSISGVQIQFGFIFNLDGDAGCNPNDTSGLHSEGLSAIANVSGHELSEVSTDPRGTGWYDSSGSENADKCAWTFNGNGLNTFTNKSVWKIQGNWSNNAYNNGQTGYANGGCISGN
jgi:hypothetical protein